MDDLAQAWSWQQHIACKWLLVGGDAFQSRREVLSDLRVLAEFSWNFGRSMEKGGGGCGEWMGDRNLMEDAALEW